MKKVLFIYFFISHCVFCNCQTISKANFRMTESFTELASIEILIDNISIKINGNGEISGCSYLLGGEFVYYKSNETSENVGKVKSIGDVKISYNKSNETSENVGKIKSIGDIKVVYFRSYETSENIGKIKSIGDVQIDFYRRNETSENIGKIKSIGNIKIDYFRRNETSENVGKIKWIKGNTLLIYATIFN